MAPPDWYALRGMGKLPDDGPDREMRRLIRRYRGRISDPKLKEMLNTIMCDDFTDYCRLRCSSERVERWIWERHLVPNPPGGLDRPLQGDL